VIASRSQSQGAPNSSTLRTGLRSPFSPKSGSRSGKTGKQRLQAAVRLGPRHHPSILLWTRVDPSVANQRRRSNGVRPHRPASHAGKRRVARASGNPRIRGYARESGGAVGTGGMNTEVMNACAVTGDTAGKHPTLPITPHRSPRWRSPLTRARRSSTAKRRQPVAIRKALRRACDESALSRGGWR
jgi:hypothetical protein